MAKTLYIFAGSVWAASAELAVAELGYKEGDITVKSVNLVEGENFAPSFLAINPAGTLPTLEADGQNYTSSTEVIRALIKDAPVKVKEGSAIIETFHQETLDPNFAMLLARDDAELTAKSAGLAGLFLSRRQAALEKHAADPGAEPYKAFYETKKGQNGGLLAIVTGKAPAEHKAGFFANSQKHFEAVKSAVLEILPGALPDSGFVGGEVPGEDDFHLGAWLTRIAATTGAMSADDALAAFEKAYGVPPPAKVASYWGAWTARPSWKKVYAGGLH
ncbi:hypothetical protein DFH08DRAFT_912120 [Mycena albidolilacea]|uniref:GST N-terminal domain-containing protein n=1 Tax=Mycena albidolilacea TaxID=1033008 RepID=A0AAD7EYM9_9AGAR|nr:hypothetical protein DFH08DRAFT_912120 [Mycena albidolilacea]